MCWLHLKHSYNHIHDIPQNILTDEMKQYAQNKKHECDMYFRRWQTQ